MPDLYLDKAIKTGFFDYVLVQFYNNPPCQYNTATGDATLLLKSWDAWTSLVLPNNTVFMGLPAAPSAAPSGDSMMLEINNNYSNQIKGHVKQSDFRFVMQVEVSKAIVGSVSAALNVVLPT
ncbi:chitinase [Trifolium repens]|nr:chitinase [Trifolium repens]